jgi:hypothetical protein
MPHGCVNPAASLEETHVDAHLKVEELKAVEFVLFCFLS